MTDFLNKLPFANHAWFLYLRLLTRHYLEDNCTQKAASLTYTTMLSVVPMIAVLIMIISTVPALESFREQMQQTLYSNLLPSSSVQVHEYLSGFAEKSIKMSFIGFGVLMFTTVMMLITIETAFNQIWRVQERSGGIDSIVRFVMMIVVTPVILAVAFMASSAVQSINFFNQKIAGYGIDWGVWAQILSFIITIGGFCLMYWFIPKVKVPFKNAIIAGIIITVLFEILKRLFGFVITNFTSYEAVYGAFAAIPAFLMWLYLSWNLILLGVEISYTLTIFDTKEVAVRHPMLSLLDMLNLIYKKYQENLSVSEQELRDVLGRKELPKWQLYISQLENHALITRTSTHEYTLKKDLSTINLWEFYRTLPYPLPIKDELDALSQADYDPWFIELYQHLVTVETAGKTALNLPLSYLFDTAPIRQKEEITHITPNTNHSDDRTDKHKHDTASYDATARRAYDESRNTIVVPDGVAHTNSSATKWLKRLKTARHWLGQSKKLINDIKNKS